MKFYLRLMLLLPIIFTRIWLSHLSNLDFSHWQILYTSWKSVSIPTEIQTKSLDKVHTFIYILWNYNYNPITIVMIRTAWKVSKYGVFLVRIFSYSDWIRIDSISPYSVRMRKNTEQKKLCIWVLFIHCLCFLYCINQRENILAVCFNFSKRKLHSIFLWISKNWKQGSWKQVSLRDFAYGDTGHWVDSNPLIDDRLN